MFVEVSVPGEKKWSSATEHTEDTEKALNWRHVERSWVCNGVVEVVDSRNRKRLRGRFGGSERERERLGWWVVKWCLICGGTLSTITSDSIG